MNDFEQSKQMEEKNVIKGKKKIFNYIWILWHMKLNFKFKKTCQNPATKFLEQVKYKETEIVEHRTET